MLSGCGEQSGVPGFAALQEQVQSSPVGRAADEWIELRNSAGDWERVGLIFGYVNDRDECEKAIAGLHRANPHREYRCTTAN